MTITACVKPQKSTRGHRREKRCQGRPLLAFILTLDSVSRAPTIERGWKRSAFAFNGASNLGGMGLLLTSRAHDQQPAAASISRRSTNHLFGLRFQTMISQCRLPSCLRLRGGRGPIQIDGHRVRPQGDSGSPACERPLDRACWFAPSSTTAPPAYGPLRSWPRRGASAP